jgi:hypothetical protein
VAGAGDTLVGAARIGNGNAERALIEDKTQMSDQENRKLQHTDEQKPDSAHKSGTSRTKQENPSGQPKSPRSEQEKRDQEKKKQA